VRVSDEPEAWPAAIHETHSSVVVFLGDRAYKVKKPVDLGFLDFRTREAREQACHREVELNRRLAPDVYLGVADVLGPDGKPCDHLVVMRRMPEELRLSRLVRGDTVAEHLRRLARLLAAFHAAAPTDAAIAAEGSRDALARRWSDNLRETDRFRGRYLDPDDHTEMDRLVERYLNGRAPLFAERVRGGLIRDGHGDLVAQDIFCLPDGPRVLDCLDFDDRLRWLDVLDDVCFLAMDLEHLERPDLAEQFLAWYAEFSGHPRIPTLEHHYIAYRAFVRAKVTCLRAEQEGLASAPDALDYTALALRHLRLGAPTLVLVGGAPGTGKSTVARALAERLGWVLLRSDDVRREVTATPERYTSEAVDRTYAALLARARSALEHGEHVILDATWRSRTHREGAELVAQQTFSDISCFECQAPADIAAARAERRLRDGEDASEAGRDVAARLAAQFDPWPEAIPLDTSKEPEHAIATALRHLSRDSAGS
jgi:uncharacterized protein